MGNVRAVNTEPPSDETWSRALDCVLVPVDNATVRERLLLFCIASGTDWQSRVPSRHGQWPRLQIWHTLRTSPATANGRRWLRDASAPA
jgi:hypothetical protein